MFYEVLLAGDGVGKIAVAEQDSQEGTSQTWVHLGNVLMEPFHLSYPLVVQDPLSQSIYMIPETNAKQSIRLYQAISFPFHWELKTVLLEGERFLDTTLLLRNGLWWLFTTVGRNRLDLYWSTAVEGPYTLHPASPLSRNDRDNRSGGRISVRSSAGSGGETYPYRIAQDVYYYYGALIRAFRIETLTPETYQETLLGGPLPLLMRNMTQPWRYCGVHHLDAQVYNETHYLVAIDGISYLP